MLLAERPGEEIALGLVGRFWRPVIRYADVTAEEFRDFAEPGYAKTVYALSVRPLDAAAASCGGHAHGDHGRARLALLRSRACARGASGCRHGPGRLHRDPPRGGGGRVSRRHGRRGAARPAPARLPGDARLLAPRRPAARPRPRGRGARPARLRGLARARRRAARRGLHEARDGRGAGRADGRARPRALRRRRATTAAPGWRTGSRSTTPGASIASPCSTRCRPSSSSSGWARARRWGSGRGSSSPSPLPTPSASWRRTRTPCSTSCSRTWTADPAAIAPGSRRAYREAMDDPSTIAAMCGDYRASFHLDRRHDAEDRDAGRRVTAPLLLVTGEEETQLADAPGDLARVGGRRHRRHGARRPLRPRGGAGRAVRGAGGVPQPTTVRLCSRMNCGR